MIGKRAEETLNRAVRRAVDGEHEYFTLEHVLLSLLEDGLICEVLEGCGAQPEKIRNDLEAHLQKEVPKVKKNRRKPAPTRAEGAEDSGEEELPAHPVATLSIQRLIQRALFQVQSSGKNEIQPEDLLVALFQSKDSYALITLKKNGVERLDVIRFISHGISKGAAAPMGGGEAKEEPEAASSPASNEEVLLSYTLDLNERARKGQVDPLVGRSAELERMTQILCRRRKNNILLVGEAGVGKTSLAEGLALQVVEEKAPPALKDAHFYALDLGALLAGTRFRGDFEQRVKKVLKALSQKKARGQLPVLMIDEIHMVVGAGAVSGGTMDIANLLKPALSQGEIRCIGSTTYVEYRSTFSKDSAFSRRFQKIDVAEPNSEETIAILEGLKGKFEEYHGVKYSPEAVRAAVELSVQHIPDRHLPDKAIDLMDEAGAKARLRAEVPALLDRTWIEGVVAQVARLPIRTSSLSQKDRLKNLERDLKLAIFGQDDAIESVATAIRLARSGLRSGERPVGSFLFCGPTGVGKTELSKQLARCLGVSFSRFDMSEYGEKHSVSRLIGAPPGYVGFEQAGLLTEAVIKAPHGVVLLDEIEKAHPEIWNLLLQVMDHGTLTDNSGKKADFRNTVLILTSNVGSREMERRSIGMLDLGPDTSASQKAVERVFSPEFRNRLDGVLYFSPLSPEALEHVVQKQLLELEALLLAQNVEVEFTPEVRQWLAQNGYDRRMGARPLARLIQDRIKKHLAEEILFGRLEKGGQVKVGLVSGDLQFEVVPAIVSREKEEVSVPAGSGASS